MKILTTSLFLMVSVFAFAQEVTQLRPTIGKTLDFGPEVQKEWIKRDRAMKSLASGDKSLAELSEEEKTILQKYGEVYESMWDVLGGCSWYCGAGVSKITASSFLSAQGKNNYEPSNAHDFSYKTAWIEGADGYGIGEYLEYEFPPTGPRINTLIVVNGYVKSKAAWEDNSRVKKLKMYVDDKPYAILNLEDIAAEQVFEIKPVGYGNREDFKELEKKPSWKLRFEILDVYKGKKYADVVISEIYFDGLDVHCFGAGTKISMADGSEKNIEDLAIGEDVMSYNLLTKAYEAAKVIELASPFHTNLIEVNFSDGSAIKATQDHPFFNGHDWLSYSPKKTSLDYQFDKVLPLEEGSELLRLNGSVKVEKITQLNSEEQTYTIVQLERNNVFIANGLLVGTEATRTSKGGIAHRYTCPLGKD